MPKPENAEWVYQVVPPFIQLALPLHHDRRVAVEVVIREWMVRRHLPQLAEAATYLAPEAVYLWQQAVGTCERISEQTTCV